MNKDTSVPVIHRSPAIYFALLWIFSLTSRLISVSNAYEAEFPASKTNPSQRAIKKKQSPLSSHLII